MSGSKRKQRLDSPNYRENIGKSLRQKRIDLDFSVSDIAYMTTITDNTVLSIEKGITTNIDYYVEYAKAVKYPLETLHDFKIELVPTRTLPPERQEKVKLTSKIRKSIIETKFLKSGKTVSEIKDELVRLKLIDEKKITSTEISGVLRNLVQDKIIKVASKEGRKNLYVRIK